MGNEQMQVAMKELQDAMVVLAHIEKTQSEHGKTSCSLTAESEKLG